MGKIEELKGLYFGELKLKVLTDPEYNWPDKSDEKIMRVVNSMFGNFGKPGDRSDWLKHNPALRSACKKIGIKSSPEFRALFQANPVGV